MFLVSLNDFNVMKQSRFLPSHGVMFQLQILISQLREATEIV